MRRADDTAAVWQREGRNKWPRQSNKMRKLRGFPYHAGLFPTGQHKLLPNTCCCARAVLFQGSASWGCDDYLKV